MKSARCISHMVFKLVIEILPKSIGYDKDTYDQVRW